MIQRVPEPPALAPRLAWLDTARELLDRLATTQAAAIEEAAQYREHARRLARAIIQQGNADPAQQEV